MDQATISVKVKKGFITLFHSNFDLCQYYQCPVPEGPVDVSLPEQIPHEVPKGKYEFQIVVTDPDYTGDLVCVNGQFYVQ